MTVYAFRLLVWGVAIVAAVSGFGLIAVWVRLREMEHDAKRERDKWSTSS